MPRIRSTREGGEVSSTNGVLPIQRLRQLVSSGVIEAATPIEESQFQPASLDLRLGSKAYRVRSSFLPGSDRVETLLDRLTQYEIDLTRGATLERGVVYVIPLQESLDLPPTLRAKTNPRSTVGRLDVFTRTITDMSHRFEEVAPGYRGPLYLEVVPGTFAITVREGQRLNQIRVATGDVMVTDAELAALVSKERLLYSPQSNPLLSPEPGRVRNGLFLSIALKNESAPPAENGIVAFRSQRSSDVIDLSRTDFYDPRHFWDALRPAKDFVLQPEEFYIVASRERVRVPIDFAAEMVAYDYFSGELRTHYAGFFDPGFGYGSDGSVLGTHAVLEVRSHEVPFRLAHGQLFCRLQFERMTERPDVSYGEAGSRYQFQALTLAKQFRDWDEDAVSVEDIDERVTV